MPRLRRPHGQLSTYTLERLRPELLGHAAELARHIRGGTLDEWISYFDWKYLRNPYVAEPLFQLAVSSDRAIGMRGLYGTCWEAGERGRRHVFPAAGDSTILEEHRGEHLYRKLGEILLDDARARGYTHVLNLSASRQTALTALITYGWKGVVPRDVMTTQAPASGDSAMRRHLRHLPDPLRALLRRGAAVTRGPERPPFAELDRPNSLKGPAAEQACRLTSSASELADVAQRAGGDRRFRLVRDTEFLRWRLSNPRATYRALVSDGGDEGCGYMIVCKKPNLRPVFVLDWQGTSEPYREALASYAVARLSAVTIWTGTLSSDELATLRAHGFVRLGTSDPTERRRKGLLVRPLADPGTDASWVLDGRRLDVASSWNVQAIGSDYY